MLSDASSYGKHHSLQMSDTKYFLDSAIKKMDWSREEEDIVMDIGCGPGNTWRDILLPSFPRVKKVIAVDALPDMIEFAKRKNSLEKIEYHVVDIQESNAIEKWAGQITKVISIDCLHWLDDQEVAFRNIYSVLKSGGEAALFFVLSSSLWNSYDLLINSPRWSKYLKNANPRVPVSHIKKYDSSHYRAFLEEMGFEICICEEEDMTYTYPNDEECKAGVFLICGLSNFIPDEMNSEFREDLFQAVLSLNGRDSDGRPLLHYRALNLLLKKN